MPGFDPGSIAATLSRARAHDHPVAVSAAGTIGHAAWVVAVARWRAAFAAHPGRSFALHHDDSFEFASMLFGAWHAGKLVHLAADLRPATLQRLREMVDGFAGSVPAWCAPLQPRDATAERFEPLALDREVLVVSTSGSSGAPLAIPKRLAQLADEVVTLEACFGERVGAAVIEGTVSHQHIYGLLFRVLWPLATGRCFARQRLDYPEQLSAALQRAPCVLVASPAFLKRLPQVIDRDPARARLHACFSSGGPLADAAARRVGDLLGSMPIQVYGSTETGGIAQRSDPAEPWRTFPGIAVRISGAGELEVRSPYLRDAEWHPTGDRARLVADDRFDLEGRIDRVVKLEEKRVSLAALERGLVASGLLEDARLVVLAGVRECLACVAIPNQAGQALLERGGKVALNAALRAAAAEVVEPVALPRRWRFLAALPVDRNGKTSQSVLAAQFSAVRPVARVTHDSDQRARLEFDVDPSSPQFEGHFPGAAILPGVAQLDWAIGYGRELFGLPSQVLRVEALKFQRVIRPGAAVTLDLELTHGGMTLVFKLHSGDAPHASGRVVFGAGL